MSRDKVQEHKLVHVRQIRVEAFDIGDNKLLIRGFLEDDRPLGVRKLLGGIRPPGILHGLRLDMIVSMLDTTIIEVEASMPNAPMELCYGVLPEFQKLVGLTIASGFNHEVKRLLGGSHSCAHFVSLIQAMAPVALQGHSAALGTREQPETDSELWSRAEHVINTCRVWAEDGPLARQVKRETQQAPR